MSAASPASLYLPSPPFAARLLHREGRRDETGKRLMTCRNIRSSQSQLCLIFCLIRIKLKVEVKTKHATIMNSVSTLLLSKEIQSRGHMQHARLPSYIFESHVL